MSGVDQYDQVLPYDVLLSTHITGKYITVATLTLLTYDSILTFDDEEELIHHAPWGLTKVLFLLNKYVTLVVLFLRIPVVFLPDPPDAMCFHLRKVNTAGFILTTVVINWILILRVYAMTSSRRILYLFGSCYFFLAMASGFYLAIKFRVAKRLPTIPPFTGCRLTAIPHLFVFYLSGLALEAAAVILIVVKGIQHVRSGADVPILKAMMRDGIIYFLVIFAVIGFVTVANFVPILMVAITPSNFQFPVISLACRRLMLRIRIVAEKKRNERTLSDLERDPTTLQLSVLSTPHRETFDDGTPVEFARLPS